MIKGFKRTSVLIKPGRWLQSCLLFFYISSCNNSNGYHTYIPSKQDSIQATTLVKHSLIRINQISKKIKSGDVITRTGSDFTSECLRQINGRDKTWSHCGIASIENDSLFVYHALGGDFNPDEKLKRDDITVFADPVNNRGIGVYREQIDENENITLIKIAKKLYAQQLKFDMDFDLKTDERMYCAEFVYKAFLWSTQNRIHFSSSTIKEKTFIGVDDIILHEHCRQIEKLFYKSMQ